MAALPFVTAFRLELLRASDALRNLREGAESTAAALLKDAAGMAKHSSMNEGDREKELSRIKSQAESLQGRVLTMKRVTRENANELNRIALEVSSDIVALMFY
jgi:hypothetical protein